MNYYYLLYKIECFIAVSISNKIDNLTCVVIHDDPTWLSWSALEVTALFFTALQYMDAWNMKYNSRVEPNISLARFAHS